MFLFPLVRLTTTPSPFPVTNYDHESNELRLLSFYPPDSESVCTSNPVFRTKKKKKKKTHTHPSMPPHRRICAAHDRDAKAYPRDLTDQSDTITRTPTDVEGSFLLRVLASSRHRSPRAIEADLSTHVLCLPERPSHRCRPIVTLTHIFCPHHVVFVPPSPAFSSPSSSPGPGPHRKKD